MDFKGINKARHVLARPWTENCLTLTVWAPRPRTAGLPVVVNFHGGAFILGSSFLFVDGSGLAVQGVLVVSLNYRLGVFGFFTMGTPEAPGNQGLMDQVLALQWVRDNAAAFGGDPAQVTLLGASAGAASVGYHLLSPASRGLFGAAVLMGGAPTNPWAIKEPEEAVKKSRELGESLGCTGAGALDCLRTKDPEDILDALGQAGIVSNDFFVPTVDGQFLVEHPSVSLAAGRLTNLVPVMAGTTSREGAGFVFQHVSTPDGMITRNQFRNLIRAVDRKITDLQVQALDVLYSDPENPNDPLGLRDAAVKLYGDSWIFCGMNELDEALVRSGAPVYRYVYDYVLSFGMLDNVKWIHPAHGSEFIPIIGNRSFMGNNATDLAVADKFRQHFLNFLRNRDPNLSKVDYPDDPSWPPFDLTHKRHLHFGHRSSVQRAYRSRECRAWTELLPALASAQTGKC